MVKIYREAIRWNLMLFSFCIGWAVQTNAGDSLKCLKKFVEEIFARDGCFLNAQKSNLSISVLFPFKIDHVFENLEMPHFPHLILKTRDRFENGERTENG